jgi:hypothetical protein
LRNNALAVHRKDGTEKRTLCDAAALRLCLETDFGLRLPESEELDAALLTLTLASAGVPTRHA